MDSQKSKIGFPLWLKIALAVGVGFLLVLFIAGAIFFAQFFAFGGLSTLEEGSPISSTEGVGGFMGDSESADISKRNLDGGSDTVPVESGAAPTDEANRKIIKTATITSVVKSLDDASEEAEKLAKKYSGYVISKTKYDDTIYSQESVAITVRVPAESFEALVKDLEEIGRVTYQTSSGDDVTDEYVDLTSKLKNLEAGEAQYIEIMKKATKVSEILEVQKELTNIRSEIEVIKGRMKYIEGSAELSTVSISFTLEEKAQEITDPSWDPQGTAANALRALVATLQFVVDTAIYIIILSPLILVPGLLIFFAIKLLLKAKKK